MRNISLRVLSHSVSASVRNSGDVTWNESAFDSLVIPNEHKHVVKSLVESHERNAKKNIDDIIQG